jgi:metabolite-proton symporter
VSQVASPAVALDAGVRRTQVRRALVASVVGTSIEWYDFYLYGSAAALVFPQKFFPSSDPFTGTLLAYSTYFVGFVSRPVGALIFGHYGDRLGRKVSLIATLLLMGIATAGIGLVPDYSRIGIWGAVFLTLGRMLQGIGVGGEWGGSVLLAAEWGDQKQRGFVASWPHVGAPVGLVLSNGALALSSAWMSEADFLAWGWRIPFLLSLVLIAIGFYIRIGVMETPAFQKLRAEGKILKSPVGETLRQHWKAVTAAMFLRTSQQTAFFIFTNYVLTYGTQVLGLPRSRMLASISIAAILSMLTIPLFGWLSDIIGRRRVVGFGCVVMLVWPFVWFHLLDTRSATLIFIAMLVALPVHDLQYGPQAAFIAESFPSSVRYTGSSLGYQLSSITAGGPAPLVAVWLYQTYRSPTAIAIYLVATSLISLWCVALLPPATND